MKGLKSSVDKTFAILEYFTVASPEWGVTELAEEIGANKSTVYRFLSDMEKRGVMEQNVDTGKYKLGLKLFELGNRVQIQAAFADKTHKELVKVSKEITETVHIAVLKDSMAYYVDKAESPQGLKISTTIGAYNPWHATSLGKVLIAFTYTNTDALLNEGIFDKELKAFTKNTITEKQVLIEELEKVRKQKYAIDNEEFEIGLTCVGIPIFNQNNEFVASISAAGPTNRFRMEEVKNYVKILQSGADAIQEKIGAFKF